MNDIGEEEIKIFVDAVGNYFLQTANERAAVRGAYLADGHGRPPIFDYTGLINVSGRYRGSIYFSAPRIMVRRLLYAMHESQHSDDILLDAVGEIANTLAGNARRYFGEFMEISVPVTMAGAVDRIAYAGRTRPYVIMVDWNQNKASLVVDLEVVGK
jgi:chemotaxis protein CheX